MTMDDKNTICCTQVQQLCTRYLARKNAFEQPSDSVRYYVESALSENSQKALKSDLEHFVHYGGSIPATPEMVAAYLSEHANILSVATLKRRLASMSKLHAMRGHDNPARHELVRMTMRGIARQHGKPQRQVAPILKEDLVVMLSQAPNGLKGTRDKALLILGFCAALRRSELCRVQIEDLSFNAQGIVLCLPRSKTDQNGTGYNIGIPYGRGKICPVRIITDWIELSGILSGMLFVAMKKGDVLTDQHISDRSVADIIKQYAAKAGLDPAHYSGHSLRSGLATSAAQHGVSSWKIRQQTGHKSDAMLSRYIRDGDLFADNAVGSIF